MNDYIYIYIYLHTHTHKKVKKINYYIKDILYKKSIYKSINEKTITTMLILPRQTEKSRQKYVVWLLRPAPHKQHTHGELPIQIEKFGVCLGSTTKTSFDRGPHEWILKVL